MFRGLIFLVVWAVLPALGQVGSTALYTQYENKPSAVLARAVRDEVESLMAPSGFHFAWRELPAQGNESWTELAVLTFRGKCNLVSPGSENRSNRRLGWTHVSDGEVQPFAEIDCDAVRSYLLASLFGIPAPLRERVYGRALGRVVAHELLHIFARTAHHNSHGVDQATLSEAELMADRLDLEDHENGIVRVSRSSAPNSGASSGQAGLVSFVRHGCDLCHGSKGQGTERGPVLRASGRILTSVVLAAKLTKNQPKMFQRAKSLKVAVPALPEEELTDLVRFLNQSDQ